MTKVLAQLGYVSGRGAVGRDMRLERQRMVDDIVAGRIELHFAAIHFYECDYGLHAIVSNKTAHPESVRSARHHADYTPLPSRPFGYSTSFGTTNVDGVMGSTRHRGNPDYREPPPPQSATIWAIRTDPRPRAHTELTGQVRVPPAPHVKFC